MKSKTLVRRRAVITLRHLFIVTGGPVQSVYLADAELFNEKATVADRLYAVKNYFRRDF